MDTSYKPSLACCVEDSEGLCDPGRVLSGGDAVLFPEAPFAPRVPAQVVSHCAVFRFPKCPRCLRQSFDSIVPFVLQVDWISAEKIQK